MLTQMKKTRPLWLVVLAAGCIVGLAMGLRQTMGLYLRPMTMDLGIGREPFTNAMAIANLVWGICAVGAGAVSDRFGVATLGWWGMPRLGVVGPAVAFVIASAVAGLVMLACFSGNRGGVRLRFAGVRLERDIFGDILKVGAVACGNALLTIATIIIVTGLVGRYGTAALAGYGLGSRLELMLIAISFGVGGAMVAMVGANRGARQFARARQVAWTGGLCVLAATELIGLVVAIWPDLWISLFTADKPAAEVARVYLAIAGPCFGGFGIGQALYFATQGTGNMAVPFAAGVVRLLVAGVGGALISMLLGAALGWLFAAVALGLVLFGAIQAWAIHYGRTWNPEK